MAKKKKKKKADKEEAPKLNKREVKAYYKEHGWRETISHFGIAPKDLSPIVKGGKAASKKEAAPKKKKKKKEAAPKKKAAGAKKGKKKAKKTEEAPYGYKKDGTPRKPPGRKAGGAPAKKPAKKEAKKRGRPPGRPKASAALPKASSSTDEAVLDWLLAYRGKNQAPHHMVTLDNVIIDLTTKIRK